MIDGIFYGMILNMYINIHEIGILHKYISLGLYSCTLERYYVTSAKFMDVFRISCFE